MLKYKSPDTIKFHNGTFLNDQKKVVHPDILVAMVEISFIYQEIENKDLFITAVFDGEHVTNSKHYEGKAFDGRTKNLSNPFLVVDAIRKKLQDKYPGKYKILYENHGKANAHLHVQLN